MAQTAVTIRMDSDIKKRFDLLCQDFGMSANTAFNIFARAVVRNKAIPFEIQSTKDSEVVENARKAVERMRAISSVNGNSEMGLDEINAEIAASRSERR
jgi:DNA-damage-inducible protein J